jgi:hypothetical protein
MYKGVSKIGARFESFVSSLVINCQACFSLPLESIWIEKGGRKKVLIP